MNLSPKDWAVISGAGVAVLLTILIAATWPRSRPLPVVDVVPKFDCDGFRKAKWGQSYAEVKAGESVPTRDKTDYLAYDAEVDGIKCTAFYSFYEGRLWRGGYVEKDLPNDQSSIDNYHRINDLLKKKYGQPEADSVEVWKNTDAKRDFRNDKIGAIRAGLLMIGSYWQNGTTNIEHFVTGENEMWSHVIRYDEAKTALARENKSPLEDL